MPLQQEIPMEFGTFFKLVCINNDLNDNGVLALSDLSPQLAKKEVPPRPAEADQLEGWGDWVDALCDSGALDDNLVEHIRPALRAILCDEIEQTGYGFSALRKIIRGRKTFRPEPFATIDRKLNTLQLFWRELHIHFQPSDYPEKAESRGLDGSAESRAQHIASYARLAINELEDLEDFTRQWLDEQSESETEGSEAGQNTDPSTQEEGPADQGSSNAPANPNHVPAAAE